MRRRNGLKVSSLRADGGVCKLLLGKQHIASCFNWSNLMVHEDLCITDYDKLF